MEWKSYLYLQCCFLLVFLLLSALVSGNVVGATNRATQGTIPRFWGEADTVTSTRRGVSQFTGSNRSIREAPAVAAVAGTVEQAPAVMYHLIPGNRNQLRQTGVAVPAVDGEPVSPSFFVNEVALPPLTSLVTPEGRERIEKTLQKKGFRIPSTEEYVLFRRDALEGSAFVYGMCDRGMKWKMAVP